MSKKKISLKEIQKIELDILIYFDKVCKENNIKYYLSSGTLLGAVKYKGFIPWDDDIDVILMRDEYLKLMDVLKNDNDGRYKLLSIYNSKDYYYPFAKLVDSHTVLTENSKKINGMGIYIDIVPMDGYPDSNTPKHISNVRIIRNLMVRRFRIKNCIRDKFDYMSFTKEKVKFKLFKDLIYSFIDYVTLPFGYNFWVKIFDKEISKYDIHKCDYIGVRTGNFGVREAFLKEDIIEQDLYEFEGMKLTSFKNYDLYLRRKFGDYEKDPEESQKVTHHQYEAYWK